jgi:hypothetical protein
VLQQVLESSLANYTLFTFALLSPRHEIPQKYMDQREGICPITMAAFGPPGCWTFCGLYVRAYKGVKPDKEIKERLPPLSKPSQSFMKGHISSIAELLGRRRTSIPKGAPLSLERGC